MGVSELVYSVIPNVLKYIRKYS